MKTSELIALLVERDLTEEETYNLVTADLFSAVTEDQVAGSQAVIGYFRDRLTSVIFPAIRKLREAKCST